MNAKKQQIIAYWEKTFSEITQKDKTQERIFSGILSDMRILAEEPKIERHKLTRRVIEAQNFVDDFIAKHGYPPTYRQVCTALGTKSPNSAAQLLRYYRHKMVQMPAQRRKQNKN